MKKLTVPGRPNSSLCNNFKLSECDFEIMASTKTNNHSNEVSLHRRYDYHFIHELQKIILTLLLKWFLLLIIYHLLRTLSR